MDKCPECGEKVSAVKATEIPSIGMGLTVRVTEVSPPPYCPMCGHPWWREGLADEARKVIDDGR